MKLLPSELEDSDLIEGLREGAPWAAELLYHRLSPIIDRTLRRVFPSRRADHDDLAQTAFESILRSVLEHRFAAGCSLTTWASLIASRVAIDALRSRVRERVIFREGMSSSPDLLTAPEPVPLERQLEARSELQRLQMLLGTMKPEQSLTVVLHDLLGHELAEIADFTGVSAAAAQSRLVRGRKELMRQRAARRSMESQPDDQG
jgi:RNA polymerase sigma-70 factor, ECF subfamily